MTEAQSESTKGKGDQPIDNCSFDIITQIEKKADFLHSVVETYIRDSKTANRPELISLWNKIREDEQHHLDLLKEELAKDVREQRFP